MNSTQKIYGVYRAIVTDTSCFKTTGKIKTRITLFNNYYVDYDLCDNYTPESHKQSTTKDTDTIIMMPFGGGDNYGMFKLPEVNSVGIVTFIDGNRTMPLWLGSISSYEMDNNRNILHTLYPTDNLENNNSAIYVKNDKPVFNFNDENSFVIKTKTSTLDDLKKPETMQWSELPVENAFIMNKNNIILRHVIDSDSYQQIVFNHDGSGEEKTISSSFNTVLKDSKKEISINNDFLLIKSTKGNYEAKISMDDEGKIRLSSTEDQSKKVISDVIISPASMTFTSGDSKISFNRTLNSNNDSITISARNVVINASKISFGPSGYKLVATPNENMALTLEDGTMLTTVENITV